MMLESLRRWLAGPPDTPGWQEAQRWAGARGLPVKQSVDRDGFIVDGGSGPEAWRLEWGPSQRRYVMGHELRLRATFEADPLLHAAIMSRPLIDTLEREVYALYTDNVQTRLDDQIPEEMRWLAMSQKLPSAQLGMLRERYGAVGNDPAWLARWLSEPLRAALLALPQPVVGASPPFALLAQRGRLVLRTALDFPVAEAMDDALMLFEVAAREARAAGTAPAETP
jgi:hypothetical protein